MLAVKPSGPRFHRSQQMTSRPEWPPRRPSHVRRTGLLDDPPRGPVNVTGTSPPVRHPHSNAGSPHLNWAGRPSTAAVTRPASRLDGNAHRPSAPAPALKGPLPHDRPGVPLRGLLGGRSRQLLPLTTNPGGFRSTAPMRLTSVRCARRAPARPADWTSAAARASPARISPTVGLPPAAIIARVVLQFGGPLRRLTVSPLLLPRRLLIRLGPLDLLHRRYSTTPAACRFATASASDSARSAARSARPLRGRSARVLVRQPDGTRVLIHLSIGHDWTSS